MSIDATHLTKTENNQENRFGLIYATYDFFRKIEETSHQFTKDAAQMSKFRENVWRRSGKLVSSKEEEMARFYKNSAIMAAVITVISTSMATAGLYHTLNSSSSLGQLYQSTANSLSTLNSQVFPDAKTSYATPQQSAIQSLRDEMTAVWSKKQTEEDSDKEKKSSNEQRLNDTMMQTLEKLSTVYAIRG